MGYVPFHSRGFVFDDSYSEEVLLSRLQDIPTFFKASMLNIIANLINFVLDKDLACFEHRSDKIKILQSEWSPLELASPGAIRHLM